MNLLKTRDLDFITYKTEQERAVLVLGPGLYRDEEGTTMEQNLVNHLHELNNRNGNLFYRYYLEEHLFDLKSQREAAILGFEIANFYEKQTPPPLLQQLVTLPFHLILNFTPDNLLADAFASEGFPYTSSYYSPGQRPPAISAPTRETPVLYNVFGSVQNTESLVLNYEALFNYYQGIFGGYRLSEDILDSLQKAQVFVFLGFPFQRWYLPLILKQLGIGETDSILYAFDDKSPSEVSSWSENMKIRFFPGLEESVDQLYHAFKEKDFLKVAKQERTDIHDDIGSLITNGNLQEAINLLLDRASDKSIQEDTLLLSGRYNNVRRRFDKGILSMPEYQTELLRMNNAVLGLAKELRNTSSMNTPSKPPLRSLEIEERKTQEQLIQRRKQEVSQEERIEIVALNTSLIPSPVAKKLQYKIERAKNAEAEKDWHEAQRLYEKAIGENANFLPAWQGLERVTKQLDQTEKQAIAADNTRLLRAIIQFEQNARLPLYLRRLEIKEVAAYGSFSWQFQPRMNVLLGRNGYGKSFLLRLVVAMLQNEYEITAGYFNNNDIDALARLQVDRQDDKLEISRDKLVFQEQFGKVPVLAISDLRFLNRANNDIGRPEGPNADLRENGALHFLQNIPYSDLIQTFLYELCLEYLDNNKSFELGIFRLIHGIVQQLTDDEFRFHSIERRDGARFHVKVITEGNPEPLPIQYASQGTLSVLAIFGLIYKYLRALNPEIEENKVLQCPGIVVIDEVDAHLHPTWQQKITMLLKETFPKVQFILTAHNPLVVAGCREKEAAVFRKTENGFHIQQFERHFIGADSTEIYWAIFETEEKDPTYLKYAAMRPFKQDYETELAELMGKYHLGEDEREQLSQLTEKIECHLAEFSEPPQVTDDILAQALDTKELARWKNLNEKRIPDASDDARINELNDILFYIGQFERIEEKQKEERRRKLRGKR